MRRHRAVFRTAGKATAGIAVTAVALLGTALPAPAAPTGGTYLESGNPGAAEHALPAGVLPIPATVGNQSIGTAGAVSWYLCAVDIDYDTLTVLGDVNLVLAPTCDISTQGNDAAGIWVEDPNRLTIYTQDLQAQGTITAVSQQSAGIGGGRRDTPSNTSGEITITGGNISATGYYGAGIGSGSVFNNGGPLEPGDSSSTSGEITITGGSVYASGYGAGIGSGDASSMSMGPGSSSSSSTSGKITISSGNVIAIGRSGAGIGSGNSNSMGFPPDSHSTSSSGQVVISGGTVDTSGTYGAGIGSGSGETSASGPVYVVGSASVTAGGMDGAGIGTAQSERYPGTAGPVTVATTGDVALSGSVPIGDTSASAWLVRTTVTGAGTVLPVDLDVPAGLEDRFPSGHENTTFSVPAGEDAAFAATPDTGHWRQTYTYDADQPVTGTTHTFSEVAADHTLAAEFAASTVIDTPEIAVDAPTFGDSLDTTASTDSDEYTVGPVTWSPSGTTAAPGTVYTASVTLTPVDRHTFSDPATVVVNGTTQGVTTTRDGESLVVATSFAATEKAATALNLTASPEAGLTLPGDVELTATLTGDRLDSLEAQTVTFTVDGVEATETTDTDGIARHLIQNPAPGDHTFGASFAGDQGNTAAAAAPITGFAVERGTRTLTMSGVADNGEYTYGDGPFVVSATVTEPSSSSPDVVFTSSDPAVAFVTDSGVGTALVTILRPGAVTLSATAPQTGVFEAARVEVPLTIAKATPMVDLTVTRGSGTTDPVVLAVKATGQGAVPKGTVTFLDGPTVLAADVPLVHGRASFTLTGAEPGQHVFRAVYTSTDGLHTTADSGQVAFAIAPQPPVVVPAADTTTAVTFAKSTVAYNAAATATVTVTAKGTAKEPTGTVSLMIDGHTYAAELSAGTATISFSEPVAVGERAVMVSYTSSDPKSFKSSTATTTLTVTKAPMKVSSTLAKRTVKTTQKAKVNVALVVTGTLKAKASKLKVKIYDGKKLLKTVTVNSAGKARVTLPKLRKGTHKITVKFAGNSNLQAKNSVVRNLKVRR